MIEFELTMGECKLRQYKRKLSYQTKVKLSKTLLSYCSCNINNLS